MTPPDIGSYHVHGSHDGRYRNLDTGAGQQVGRPGPGADRHDRGPHLSAVPQPDPGDLIGAHGECRDIGLQKLHPHGPGGPTVPESDGTGIDGPVVGPECPPHEAARGQRWKYPGDLARIHPARPATERHLTIQPRSGLSGTFVVDQEEVALATHGHLRPYTAHRHRVTEPLQDFDGIARDEDVLLQVELDPHVAVGEKGRRPGQARVSLDDDHLERVVRGLQMMGQGRAHACPAHDDDVAHSDLVIPPSTRRF